MDYLFNSNIMHGGGVWTKTQGLIFCLLYLAVMCSLWYVYYIKFENRPGFAKNLEKTSDGTYLNWVYKITTLIIIAVIAFFIFFVGWQKAVPKEKDDRGDKTEEYTCYEQTLTGKGSWEKISFYSIIPLSWLSAGFLAALVVSQTTIADLQEVGNRVEAAWEGANTNPTPKTT